ncbi:MAG: imm11 family protein [Blastomonas fulva]|uniref:imm11 family protein n=1 Tax=Alphaproteobacteria TaxID=28211 RepID=UPI00403466E8
MVYLIGSEQEMGQYPREKFLDGDPKKIKVEGPETEEKLLAINLYYRQQYNAGFRIMSENVPTVWQWNSSRILPDYYTPHAFPCVSSRFKEVVERFEPDVHQFFPITVVNKAKEKIAQRWLWVVCNRIDGVDREHTTLVLKKGALWMSNWLEDGKRVRIHDAKLYHSKTQTEGYHFWRDKHLMGGGIYASDEAAEALLALDLTAFAANKRETV